MTVENMTPQQAHDKQAADSEVRYLDVRSVPEFEQGHPAGAYNIPLMHFDAATGSMTPNADFERVAQASFSTDTPLLLGCKSGGRSLMAAERLAALGYRNLQNVLGGFDGGQAPDGSPVRGWGSSGLPVSRTPESGRDYNSLSAA